MQTRWYYIHDAQGNLMATYRYNVAAIPTESRFFLQEHPLYGSDRVGMDRTEIETTGLAGLQLMEHQAPPTTTDGHLNYELKDHLGNITTVVTGVLVALDGSDAGTDADHKVPQVVSYSGYDPFGALMPGRNYSSGSYRFGFQGQEKDNEIYNAEGSALAFEYRIHDARVGKFLSIDPLAAQYPHNSPYAFAENKVIQFVELEGLETGQIATPMGDPMLGVTSAASDSPDKYEAGLRSRMNSTPSGGSAPAVEPSAFEKGMWKADAAVNAFFNKFAGPGGGIGNGNGGGYTLTDDYATGTNNAERKGNPSGTKDATAVQARANATFGPERLTSMMRPAQAGGKLDNFGEAIGSGSGALSNAVDPSMPGPYRPLLLQPVSPYIRVGIDSIGDMDFGDGTIMIGVILSHDSVDCLPSDTAGGVLNGNPNLKVSPPTTVYHR